MWGELFPPNVGKLKAKGNIQALIAALGYKKDARVRESAAKALEEIGDDRAIEPLIFLLEDIKPVSRAAADALIHIDPTAMQIVNAALMKSKSTRMRETIVRDILTQIGGAQAVQLLIDVLTDVNTSGNVQELAIEALGNFGDLRAIQPLIDIITDKIFRAAQNKKDDIYRLINRIPAESEIFNPYIYIYRPSVDIDRIRKAAVKALVIIGVSAVEPLLAVLKDEDWNVREAGVQALDRLGWQPDMNEAGASYWAVKNEWDKCVEIGAPAIKTLITAFHYSSLSEPAAKALGQIGTAAIEPLIEVLKTCPIKHTHMQYAAIDALVRIGVPAVAPIIALLKETYNGDMRERCASALVEIGEPAFGPVVIAFKECDDKVREVIARRVLNEIGGTQAIPVLIAGLEDESREVRQAASWSLAEIGRRPLS